LTLPPATLPGVLLLSGAAALVFQTLWFRLAGLALGSGVLASSLVLASFMAGLALGNGLAARLVARVSRPFRLYASLELVIAAAGFAVVALLPVLTRRAAPLFATLIGDHPGLLQPARMAFAFPLLLLPTTAMGATLPALVAAMDPDRAGFGNALGRAYGWNTFGALLGALAGELLLIPRLGIMGAGAAAAAFDVLAALLALSLDRASWPTIQAPREAARPALAFAGRAWPTLLAAALCGGILLALEVVWFRFLLLFFSGTSLTFAVMLAVVLLGIALGGLLAAAALRRRPTLYRAAPLLAIGSCVATLGAYAGLTLVMPASNPDSLPGLVGFSCWLMLPTCVLSGALFTLQGRRLRESVDSGVRTTGALTLANTLGAIVGALAAPFLLFQGLGLEGSWLLLGLGYGGVAAAMLGASAPRADGQRRAWAWGAAFLCLPAAAALFPSGAMRARHLQRITAPYSADGSRVVAAREGASELTIYMRRDLFGEPVSHRMLANRVSMSATGFHGERYMKLYAYWPLALHPGLRRALLVCYGVGSTATALTSIGALERIDVVDLSREVLDLGGTPYPPQRRPLEDPRVRVFVEDGRFFLLSRDESYDLITAEPPPPTAAGVVNLYSREYFQLVRTRLAPGGVTTHWLPVFLLDQASAASIVRAFCDAFADCSLWAGDGLNWMLAGSRGLREPVSEADFGRPWRDPAVGPVLRGLELEEPERLGGLFLGDARFLAAFAGTRPPLLDDWPARLALRGPDAASLAAFAQVMNPRLARRRFLESDQVARLWPPALRERSAAAFEREGILGASGLLHYGGVHSVASLMVRALTETSSFVLPAVVAGSDPRELAAARRARERGETGVSLDYLLAVDGLARRDYAEAAARFSAVLQVAPQLEGLGDLRAVAQCLGGRSQEAAAWIEARRSKPMRNAEERDFWQSFSAQCLSGGSSRP
jgi:spermidine synthase